MPIISPWIFYIIDVLSRLRWVFFLIPCVIMAIIGIKYFYYHSDEFCEKCREKYYQTPNIHPSEAYKKAMNDVDDGKKKALASLKKGCIASLIIILFTSLIPSQETMYKMLVANYVTYENIDTATNAIKDGVDYIFEKLDGGE